jgi:malate dehydrogenase (oxaloacetate-decarboxylating)
VTKKKKSPLFDPFENKGTSFSPKERDELGLRGLLPATHSSIDDQVKRRYELFLRKKTPLAKNHLLSRLANTNTTLFYRLFLEHVEEVLPYVYTPTVGDAALEFSIYYETPQHGMYISKHDLSCMDTLFENIDMQEVEVIVVTDGERILGLGDVGIGGMTIPIGKLALYTVFAGIHPKKTLPIFLDVGTNNQNLLKDPLYIGLKEKRLRGQEYDTFIDNFIQSVKKAYPKVLLQWEDFSKDNAKRLLDRYQREILSFNDDIQGTAATALTGILAANHAQPGKLSEKNIVIFGGGSAGLGIANLLVDYLIQYEGLDESQALARLFIVDRLGLITHETSTLFEGQERFIKSSHELKGWSIVDSKKITLNESIINAKACILIGVSGQGNAFCQEVLSSMALNSPRPIIFALSNPTSSSEAHPKSILEVCGDQALIATGSPYAPVQFNGVQRRISQCNNVYIFPSMGLAATSLSLPYIPTVLFIEAALQLAKVRFDFKGLGDSELFIPIKDLREVTKQVAVGIGKKALELGLIDMIESEIQDKIESNIWFPDYT